MSTHPRSRAAPLYGRTSPFRTGLMVLAPEGDPGPGWQRSAHHSRAAGSRVDRPADRDQDVRECAAEDDEDQDRQDGREGQDEAVLDETLAATRAHASGADASVSNTSWPPSSRSCAVTSIEAARASISRQIASGRATIVS